MNMRQSGGSRLEITAQDMFEAKGWMTARQVGQHLATLCASKT